MSKKDLIASRPSQKGLANSYIAKTYIRDLSFQVARELASSSEVPLADDELKVSTSINVLHEELPDDKHNIVLALSVSVADGAENPVLTFDVQQGSVFKITDVSGSRLDRMLDVDCPRVALPFARELFHTCLGRSRTAARFIECVDFDAIYGQIGRQPRQALSEQ